MSNAIIPMRLNQTFRPKGNAWTGDKVGSRSVNVIKTVDGHMNGDTTISPNEDLTKTQFIADLKRASVKLSSNPADPQTGKPIKLAVSERGMAKFLEELEEE